MFNLGTHFHLQYDKADEGKVYFFPWLGVEAGTAEKLSLEHG